MSRVHEADERLTERHYQVLDALFQVSRLNSVRSHKVWLRVGGLSPRTVGQLLSSLQDWGYASRGYRSGNLWAINQSGRRELDWWMRQKGKSTLATEEQTR